MRTKEQGKRSAPSPASRPASAPPGHNFAGRTFDLVTVTQYAQEAEVVQNLLAKVGINTAVKLHPDRSWGPTIMEKYELGWGVAGGAITEFPAYHLCDLHQTGNSLNQTRISNPELDSLCAAQGREMDSTKRRQIWDQIHDMLYELAPTVPTVSTVYYLFLDCKVKNYKKVHLGRNPTGMVQAWIDPKSC